MRKVCPITVPRYPRVPNGWDRERDEDAEERESPWNATLLLLSLLQSPGHVRSPLFLSPSHVFDRQSSRNSRGSLLLCGSSSQHHRVNAEIRHLMRAPLNRTKMGVREGEAHLRPKLKESPKKTNKHTHTQGLRAHLGLKERPNEP